MATRAYTSVTADDGGYRTHVVLITVSGYPDRVMLINERSDTEYMTVAGLAAVSDYVLCFDADYLSGNNPAPVAADYAALMGLTFCFIREQDGSLSNAETGEVLVEDQSFANQIRAVIEESLAKQVTPPGRSTT